MTPPHWALRFQHISGGRDTGIENIAASEGRYNGKIKRTEVNRTVEAGKEEDDGTDLAGQRKSELKLGGGSP